MLRKVAATLTSNVRDGDSVCRYGGDEFLLILQRTTKEEVDHITQRICQRISEFPMKTKSGQIPVSISTGIALRTPGRRITSENLLELADQALYRTKQARRTGIKVDTTAA